MTQTVEAQRQIVADAAHAIRNPLTALAIRLDSLQDSLRSAQASSHLDHCRQEVARLTTLLDGLLQLTVAEAPAARPANAGPCDAVRVADTRVEAWRGAYGYVGQRLTLVRGASDATTTVPADVLEQILDVTLSNSHLYAGHGAHTTVRVDQDVDGTTLTIADNGVGVAESDLAKLTTRFYRGSSPSGTGSGLGLPIAAALAHRHGGRFAVAPVAPHGLAVKVTFRQ